MGNAEHFPRLSPARNAQHFARSDDAAHAEDVAVDGLDLVHVTAARDAIADLERVVLARELAERLSALGDELVPKGTCHGALHESHPTAPR